VRLFDAKVSPDVNARASAKPSQNISHRRGLRPVPLCDGEKNKFYSRCDSKLFKDAEQIILDGMFAE